ncbi:MAG: RES family NAD+ phosphorylase [Acetobacteraceae bacterium]
MLLWRMSTRQHADAFDGGYGLLFDGRWNTTGHAVTYCATSPSLCVLEKLVHIEDPALLPDLIMVAYEAPASLPIEQVKFDELSHDWRHHETWTQTRGDKWHQARATALLQVPSAILPIADSPDANVLVNHNHPAVGQIRVRKREPFALDPRLF